MTILFFQTLAASHNGYSFKNHVGKEKCLYIFDILLNMTRIVFEVPGVNYSVPSQAHSNDFETVTFKLFIKTKNATE